MDLMIFPSMGIRFLFIFLALMPQMVDPQVCKIRSETLDAADNTSLPNSPSDIHIYSMSLRSDGIDKYKKFTNPAMSPIPAHPKPQAPPPTGDAFSNIRLIVVFMVAGLVLLVLTTAIILCIWRAETARWRRQQLTTNTTTTTTVTRPIADNPTPPLTAVVQRDSNWRMNEYLTAIDAAIGNLQSLRSQLGEVMAVSDPQPSTSSGHDNIVLEAPAPQSNPPPPPRKGFLLSCCDFLCGPMDVESEAAEAPKSPEGDCDVGVFFGELCSKDNKHVMAFATNYNSGKRPFNKIPYTVAYITTWLFGIFSIHVFGSKDGIQAHVKLLHVVEYCGIVFLGLCVALILPPPRSRITLWIGYAKMLAMLASVMSIIVLVLAAVIRKVNSN